MVVPKHTVVGPLIDPGVAGNGTTLTVSVAAADVPQELVAVTVMVPPLAPAVAFMLVVVLVPDHPEGSVQL